MNRKLEDQLIQHAFGELDAHDAAMLEEKVSSDSAVKRKLEEFNSFKEDLSLLKEVPADQMSTERLRDAILGQGLKPLPPKPQSNWGWAWMPTTAFVIAFGFMALHRTGPKNAEFVQGPGSAVASKKIEPLEIRKLSNANIKPVAKESKLVASIMAGERKEPAVVPLRAAKVPVSVAKHSEAILASVNKPAGEVHPKVNPSSNQAGLVADASVPPAKPNMINSSPIIINSETDSNTGARKATEVDSVSNVIAGG